MTQVTKNKSFMITFEGLGFRFKFEFPAGQLKATFLAANKPAVEKIAIKAV